MNLKYHQATFEMLNLTPVISETNVAALNAREQTLGVTFPASVREWYSLEGSVEILRTHSNRDKFYFINELGKKYEYDGYLFSKKKYQRYANPRMCSFMLENQAIIELAFHLDNSDDPAVFVWSDEEKQKYWVECDKYFSSFIYDWIKQYLEWKGFTR